MTVDTAPTPAPTLALDDDLAAAPARGVERVVDEGALREAADLLLVAPSALAAARDAEVWLLRIGAHAMSALVAERDPDGIAITALSTPHAEPLLRAVLGHYALEGIASATMLAPTAPERLVRQLGFA